MKPKDEITSINGVRIYLNPAKLLSLEAPVLFGEALRSAISPKLAVTSRSYGDGEVTRDQLVDDTATIYRGLLGDIAHSPEAAALRGKCHDLAAVVPDFYTTLRMTHYWGVLSPRSDMETNRARHGTDPRTAPQGRFEQLELLVPFSFSLIACLPKS